MVSVNTIKGRARLRHVVLGGYWLCDVEVGGFLPIQVTRAIPKSAFKWHCVGPASQGPTYKNGIHTSYVEPWILGYFWNLDPLDCGTLLGF